MGGGDAVPTRPKDGASSTTRPTADTADTEVTSWIQDEANRILARLARRVLDGIARATDAGSIQRVTAYDFLGHYVDDLTSVIDMDAIREFRMPHRRRSDGRCAVAYWGAISDRYKLDLT